MTRKLGRAGLTVGPHAYGVAALGNLYREVEDDVAVDSVHAAWEQGVRYFDTAPHYGLGLSELRLGRGLQDYPREQYVISTKVGKLLKDTDEFPGLQDDQGFAVPRTKVREWDFSRDGVLRSIEKSLERLGVDRIDIALVHDPDDHFREALDGAFPALEELRSQGVIASYGAGMNQSEMLTKFVQETDLDVVMVAGRYSLLEQPALADLLPAAQERDVSVIAAGVFNSGLLATNRPAADAKYNYAEVPADLLARVHKIADVCEAHGVTLPTAAAQFPLRHPAVATVCLGARSRSQVERNAALFDVAVPEALWTDLQAQGLLRA